MYLLLAALHVFNFSCIRENNSLKKTLIVREIKIKSNVIKSLSQN